MASVQYYQALRISEAAAIHWEDVVFSEPIWESRLVITKSVVFPRIGGKKPILQVGFKNSVGNGGMKEQPLFPETYEALTSYKQVSEKGLIFHKTGNLLTYRMIQNAYNTAFINSGLPYRSTHVMRHGGCRHVFNQTTDLGVAQQHLGNTSLKSTLVYAKRYAGALTKVVNSQWKKKIENQNLQKEIQ